MAEISLSQSRLKKLFSYDPDTGVFIRLTPTKGCDPNKPAGFDDHGYRRICVNNKQLYAHRLAFLYMTGLIPDEVDHRNRIKNDNSWSNLREIKHADNLKNTHIRRTNKTGIAGVWWCDSRKRFHVYIDVNNHRIRCGSHRHIFEAACARFSAEHKYWP